MKRRHLALAAGAVLAAPARALMAGRAPDSPLARVDANRADAPMACVASLIGGGTYSAVCITPTFVLTAGHVAAKAADLFLCLNLGRDLSHRWAIKRAVTPPVPVRPDPMLPIGDLALLELDGRLPEALALPPLAQTTARAGLRIELAGYGASGFGDRGVSVASNPALRRVGANRIDRIASADDPARTPLLYFFGFDAPGAASLGNAVEAGLASGDSGGPAFVREGGRLALLGINSFVMRSSAAASPANGFGSIGGGQVLAAYRPWLAHVLGERAWPGLG